MNPFKLIGIVDSLLIPIQRAISVVLPDFLEEALEEEQTRDKIIDAADKTLVGSTPEARLVPEKVRRRLIGRFLDIILDDILLPE